MAISTVEVVGDRLTKICPRCEQRKTAQDFHSHARNPFNLADYCKPCAADRSVVARQRPSAKVVQRKATLKHRYGITEAELVERIVQQSGVCAICHGGFGEKGPCIDHDHACCPTKNKTCGKCIRGILCHRCNVVLGMADDNVGTLLAAASYLEGA